MALYGKPPICGNADDDQHHEGVTEPFEYFHEFDITSCRGAKNPDAAEPPVVGVLFRVVKSQAADREIDDFMSVPRSRPG